MSGSVCAIGGFARWTAAAALALCLGVTGCGTSRSSSSSATFPPVPTTTPADRYAVPPTIDTTYVDRVLAGLDQVYGDATRIIVNTGQLAKEATARLAAIYNDERFSFQTNHWVELISKQQLSRFGAYPGNQRTHIVRLLSATPDCVYVAVTRDYSAVASGTPTAQPQFVGLRPLPGGRDPGNLNPTHWLIVSEGANPDSSAPASPC
jgi:hypothetical protein